MNSFEIYCAKLDQIWAMEDTIGRDEFHAIFDEFTRQNVYGHITTYAMELIKRGFHTDAVFYYATGNHF